ncbi:hypothetical protein A9995_03855 [Erythrobacter sp. QSSC1-22B]|uniref:toll/interleukin-1 receptor domain-containing protein n=1 Tax=Erythrobacter sp. QSSC1-22B TaxID=1860125 RepID=UPI0008049870|nr:toll/interleukin-1 receptor domain-containing protein [Erythrobacter sp. QSSC1-22B]OBX19712.1 hypothetical protein A9995_03855 [Erythrobacter sp. QSSC1-22B]
MAERFSAFISYSHHDSATARQLHRAIESYRFPKNVIGTQTAFGPAQRKLKHVFRDRDELAASGDLGEDLKTALADSRFQIVICSPSAARSKWVNEEILIFKRQHGEARTLAVIVAGEPYTSDETECFPPALQFRLDSAGDLSDLPAEPVAADLRPGKDGKRLARLKLLAGLSGLGLDDLTQRDTSRRQRQMMLYSATSTVIAFITIGLAIYAEDQRRVAVAERNLAESSLEFLAGTFEIANPATENPRTITAITVLDRASKRASGEFGQRPEVAARLLRTTGEIYRNLGLLDESERDLTHALKLEPANGSGRAGILLELAVLASKRGDAKQLERLVKQAGNSFKANDEHSMVLAISIDERHGDLAFLKANYREAARRYAKAAAGYQNLDGEHRAQVAENLMDQAYALVQAADFDRVDALYAKAHRMFLQRYGPRDVRTARALHNQAFASLSAGKPEDAIPRMDSALKIYSRVLEPAHPDLAAARLLMGRIFAAQGDTAKAVDNFRMARAIFSAVYGEGNAAVGDTDFYTAEALGRSGRFDEALALTGSVKQIYDTAYGAEDPDQAELLMLRSRIHASAGNSLQASAQCRAALALYQRIGSEREIVAQTNRACAELSVKQRTTRVVINQ